MKTAACLVLTALLVLPGCIQLRYGWKQERELLDRMGASIRQGARNENDDLITPYARGLRTDLHEYHPWRDAAAGWSNDWARLVTP